MMEMEGGGERGAEAEKENPIDTNRRRYYCNYCGIGRSKKSLLASHVLSQHKEEVEREKEKNGENEETNSNTCEECGASFTKPAYLKQHMQSHSSEIIRFKKNENLLVVLA
ncbi:Transcription factor iiia [Thalictrum thalictroides]|uniref:Transcription factor iiia n=1 Tax=Thalictrum thalictroides TaxID=46969 RepID=A0A7J6XD47_THATH|nr:Transcription factor iiia [Thalictrum thalictroides]